MNAYRRFLSLRTPKFRYINRAVNGRAFALLDVGSGNHSASKIKGIFPLCEYHGIDLDKESYSYNEADNAAMTAFYAMDLTRLEFDSIPDNYFDVMTMAHIIEHLHNGDEVIARLVDKLKPGGHLYIEYPGKRSLKLPSMTGTLNFYDDPTHVRIYSVSELKRLLDVHNCTVIESGTRRSWFYVAAMPFRIVGAWMKGRKPMANVFWDLLGFAEFLFAKRG